MEVQRVEDHPLGCTACKSATGPFVVTNLPGFTTTIDDIPAPTTLVLCLSTDQREGCAGSIARAAGYVPPDEHQHALDQYRDTLDRHALLEEKIARLELASGLHDENLAARIAEKLAAGKFPKEIAERIIEAG